MARKPTRKRGAVTIQKPAKEELEIDEGMTTTAVHLPVATFKLLRAVAFVRAQNRGGRPSVSALITELAESHRKELEVEATKALRF